MNWVWWMIIGFAALWAAFELAPKLWRYSRSQGAHGASATWTWMKDNAKHLLTFAVVVIVAVLVFILGKEAIAKLDKPAAPRLDQPVVRPRIASDKAPDLQHKGQWEPFEAVFTATIPADSEAQWAFVGVQLPETDAERGLSSILAPSGRVVYLVSGELVGNQPQTAAVLEELAAGPAGPKAVQKLTLPFYEIIPNRRKTFATVYAQTGYSGDKQELAVQQAYKGRAVHQEFVLLDGADVASFRVPSEGWRYLWIIPIYDPKYESSLAGRPVSARGLTHAELEKLTYSVLLAQGAPADDATLLKARVETAAALANAPIDVNEVQYHGAYYRLRGKVFPLVQGKVFDTVEAGAHGQEITLGVNVPPQVPRPPKPIKILIGIAH